MALLVSPAGLEALEHELSRLHSELSEVLLQKGENAIQLGDSSFDNFDFEQYHIREIVLMTQISKLSEKISTARVITDDSSSDSVVHGSVVTLAIKNGASEVIKKIIFSDSDEPSELTKVSMNSPLGKLIHRKKRGFSGSYAVKKNLLTATILAIE